MYADNEYYCNEFCEKSENPVIPEAEQTRYLRRASAFLDTLFLVRKPSEPYDEKIKNACCEIAEAMYKDGTQEGIASENVDGYSVSFAKDSTGRTRYYELACYYLAGTGLLYRGIG